jgi:hypothetical protein
MDSCVVNERIHEAIITGVDSTHLAELKAFVSGDVKTMLRSMEIASVALG